MTNTAVFPIPLLAWQMTLFPNVECGRHLDCTVVVVGIASVLCLRKTRRQEDKKTRRQEDKKTRRQEDKKTRRQEDKRERGERRRQTFRRMFKAVVRDGLEESLLQMEVAKVCRIRRRVLVLVLGTTVSAEAGQETENGSANGGKDGAVKEEEEEEKKKRKKKDGDEEGVGGGESGWDGR